MRFPQIRRAEDIEKLVEETGFLPFFANEIRGFSVEERCAPELWFAEGRDGPWEWKGPVARSGRCVYGKFFRGRAGFVSKEMLPDFCNFRRDGYDFDARFNDGLASYKDKGVYDVIVNRGAALSKELKDLCRYRKGGNTGFDGVITRLQMQTYALISDFVYLKDSRGRPYGWGVALYSTPEALFGYDFVAGGYARSPLESRARIAAFLKKSLPHASDGEIARLLG